METEHFASAERRVFGELARMLLATFAAAPFWSLALAHWLTPSDRLTTGFYFSDMPYYVANGREIFERGNGITYPNPFDPSPDAPAIYFHWLLWLMGFGVCVLHVDPALWSQAILVVGGVICSRLMLSLVEARLPTPRFRTFLYMLTMWGGGALVATQIWRNVERGVPAFSDALALDPVGGWWFQNFGRNLVYPTEAVYHALMVTMWLGLYCCDWKLALAGLFLAATTHPFTGMQAVAISAAFVVLDRLISKQPAPPAFVAGVVTVGASFLWYYLVFLPSFPEHVPLQRQNSLNWCLPGESILPAYMPALLTVAAALGWRRLEFRRDFFFVVAGIVSFLLAKHEWFLQPRQPIHFTRGYIWTAIWLLGLPGVQFGLEAIERYSRVLGRVAMGALLCLFGLDNAVFLSTNVRGIQSIGYYLKPEEREAFDYLAVRRYDGVVLTFDGPSWHGHLLAVYTPARPWCGHVLNTPHFDERRRRINDWTKEPATSDLTDEVDSILGDNEFLTRCLDPERWSKTWHQASISFWEKIR